MTATSLVKLDQTEIVSAMRRAISGSWINRGPNIKKKEIYVEQKKRKKIETRWIQYRNKGKSVTLLPAGFNTGTNRFNSQ